MKVSVTLGESGYTTGSKKREPLVSFISSHCTQRIPLYTVNKIVRVNCRFLLLQVLVLLKDLGPSHSIINKGLGLYCMANIPVSYFVPAVAIRDSVLV